MWTTRLTVEVEGHPIAIDEADAGNIETLNNDPRHEKAFFVDGCAKHEDCKRHSLDGHESKYDPYDDIDESLLEINMNDSY